MAGSRDAGAAPDSVGDAHDMRLPESFKSKKRFFLATSTALLILGYSTQLDPSLNTGLLNLRIDPVALWWGVFAAAIYYGLGFADDVRFTRLLNSRAGRNLPGVRATFDGLFGDLSMMAKQMRKHSGDLDSHLTRFFASAPTEERDQAKVVWELDPAFYESGMHVAGVPSHLSDEFKIWVDHIRPVLAQEVAELHGDQTSRFRQAMDDWRAQLTDAVVHLQGLSTLLPDLTVRLGDVQKNLSVLAEGIEEHRRRSFVWWEVGAPAALFLFAWASGAPQFTHGIYNLFAYGGQHAEEFWRETWTFPAPSAEDPPSPAVPVANP